MPTESDDDPRIMKYETLTTNPVVKFSTKDLIDATKRLQWISYEVDPEWARFCSFGPDDIGGPWEKLGIIRRRPRYDNIFLDAITRRSIEVDDTIIREIQKGDPAWPLNGIPIHDSPAGNFLVRMDYMPLLPSRHMIVNLPKNV